MRCFDGFVMSVQASCEYFCTHLNDDGPHIHVEVDYPNRLKPLRLPHADTPNVMIGASTKLHVNVSAEVTGDADCDGDMCKHNGGHTTRYGTRGRTHVCGNRSRIIITFTFNENEEKK